MDKKTIETCYILGIKVNVITKQGALNKIDEFIQGTRPNQIVTLGTEMVMRAQNDESYKNIINNADLVLPDGEGVVWAAKKNGKKISEKIAGIDFFISICEMAEKKNWRIFLLGAKPGIAEQVKENLSLRFTGLDIAGLHHGFFKNDNEIVNLINTSKPDILILAMGVPGQELWFTKNREKLNIKVAMGVGGSFDILSGNLKRAPGFMIKLKLEWLYRLFQEPARVKRMFVLPLFVLKVISERKNQKNIS